jgi:hypothetical protein
LFKNSFSDNPFHSFQLWRRGSVLTAVLPAIFRFFNGIIGVFIRLLVLVELLVDAELLLVSFI